MNCHKLTCAIRFACDKALDNNHSVASRNNRRGKSSGVQNRILHHGQSCEYDLVDLFFRRAMGIAHHQLDRASIFHRACARGEPRECSTGFIVHQGDGADGVSVLPLPHQRAARE